MLVICMIRNYDKAGTCLKWACTCLLALFSLGWSVLMSGDSVTDSPPSFGASQHVRQQLSGKKINQQVNGDVEPLVLPYRQFFCQGKWDAAEHPKSSRLGDMGFAIWFAIWRCSAPYVCKIQHGVPRIKDNDPKGPRSRHTQERAKGGQNWVATVRSHVSLQIFSGYGLLAPRQGHRLRTLSPCMGRPAKSISNKKTWLTPHGTNNTPIT